MNELISYSYDFISYLMMQPPIKKYSIRKILVYGSAARGDFDKGSDVDLFFDCVEGGDRLKHLSTQIEKAKEGFASSGRQGKWNIAGIKNEFSIIIDNIDSEKWDDLRKSMGSHAVVLWERYTKKSEDIKPYSLITWKIPAKEAGKRVQLARKIYGYSSRGKRYNGLISSTKARVFSNSVVIIPSEYTNKYRELFRELKVRYKIKQAYFEE